MDRFDCQACGVCCLNTERNLARETQDYIEVTKSDVLYREHREVLHQLGTRNADGVFHMKLVGDDQRCIALEGDIKLGVGCGIYKIRPRGCRKVDSGDEECLKARRAHGMPLTWPEERARLAEID